MKRSILFAVITSVLLTGCMNLDFDPAKSNSFEWAESSDAWKIAMDYYNIRTRSDTRLYTMNCPLAWSYGRVDPRLLEYYEKALVTKGLSPEHIQFIRKGELAVGMPEFALYAAWGRPRDTNTYQNQFGMLTQHVYGDLFATSKHLKPKYVHTQNGVITSITKL